MTKRKKRSQGASAGFTLIEVMISSALSLMVLVVALTIFISAMKAWRNIDVRMLADREVNLAMSAMVYGMGDRLGLRSAWTGSMTTNVTASGWTLTYAAMKNSAFQTNTITYSSAASNLVITPGSIVVGKDIAYAPCPSIGVRLLCVTLRVDRVEGPIKASRKIWTSVTWRN